MVRADVRYPCGAQQRTKVDPAVGWVGGYDSKEDRRKVEQRRGMRWVTALTNSWPLEKRGLKHLTS